MYRSGKIVALYPSVSKGVIESVDKQLGRFSLPFYFVESQRDLKIGDVVSYYDDFFRAKQVRLLTETTEAVIIPIKKEGE